MFGFNEDEIKLIETTIKKYERYSLWFKRYMCGPISVSDIYRALKTIYGTELMEDNTEECRQKNAL